MPHTTFETALGPCAIAWNDDKITAFQLPDANLPGAPSPPPEFVQKIIDRVRQHLQGELQDFRDIPVDLTGSGEFAQKVLAATRAIPTGHTTTYAEMAKELQSPGAARAVGQALGKNPIPLLIPCHRILAAGGKSGGFSAPGGVATKSRLLQLEGAATNTPIQFEPFIAPVSPPPTNAAIQHPARRPP